MQVKIIFATALMMIAIINATVQITMPAMIIGSALFSREDMTQAY